MSTTSCQRTPSSVSAILRSGGIVNVLFLVIVIFMFVFEVFVMFNMIVIIISIAVGIMSNS